MSTRLVIPSSSTKDFVDVSRNNSNFISYAPSAYFGWKKRVFDVLVSLVIILFVFPTLGLLGLLLTLIDNGFPLLFIQKRVGKDGNYFQCYKFRSLPKHSKSAEEASKLGTFIRRYHLDEIPQVINVLKGNMSLVGPRPHMISDDLRFSELNASYTIRHKIKPGITGWAQCKGFFGHVDSLEHLNKRTQLDLEYISTASLGLDLKILWQTFKLHL